MRGVNCVDTDKSVRLACAALSRSACQHRIEIFPLRRADHGGHFRNLRQISFAIFSTRNPATIIFRRTELSCVLAISKIASTDLCARSMNTRITIRFGRRPRSQFISLARPNTHKTRDPRGFLGIRGLRTANFWQNGRLFSRLALLAQRIRRRRSRGISVVSRGHAKILPSSHVD